MDVHQTMRNGHLSWLIVLVATLGCAKWSSAPTGELPGLPLPKLAPDSVVLDVGFVRIGPQQKGFADRFWPEVDEQALDNQLRRRLEANGIRGGIVGIVLPDAIQQILDREPQGAQIGVPSVVRPGREIEVHSQRLYSRAGDPGKILIRSKPVAKLAALTRDEDGKISGRSLEQAQLHFMVKSHPQGNGNVKLEFTPVIEYGQPRSRYAVQRGVWAVDNTSRSTKTYDSLKIEVVLTPGQSLVLTGTTEPKGLGRQFFAAEPGERPASLVLLVRLQQTQLDNSFEQEPEVEPIATISD